MPRPKTKKYSDHLRWKDCDRCELCATRRKVVLYRGRIPCHILFVGEAPGSSENRIGLPFVGPAGKLQDRMIEEAVDSGVPDKGLFPNGLRIGFTNLVACLPEKYGDKVEPQKPHILKCAPRLKEIVALAQPKGVVMVGKLSQQWFGKITGYEGPTVSVLHPAAILRLDVSQKGLAIQRYQLEVKELVETLGF